MSNTLYDRDFYAWANEQARLLRDGKLKQADIENIAEEIESDPLHRTILSNQRTAAEATGARTPGTRALTTTGLVTHPDSHAAAAAVAHTGWLPVPRRAGVQLRRLR